MSGKSSGFPGRLQSLMGTRGMTQWDLAVSVGSKQSSVSHWLLGHVLPSARHLIEISRVFAVDPEWLLTGTTSDRKPLEHVEMIYAS